MTKRSEKQSRVNQARIIVQARWDLPELPSADDVEVGWLLASGEPLTQRYADAWAKVMKSLTDKN